MGEAPVSVSGGCARAMLDGRKTMLRQVAADPLAPCPLGAAGDRLWVREPWATAEDGSLRYAGEAGGGTSERALDAADWQPARTMPRGASRMEVEIEAVRLERLQAISAGDLGAEGSLWLPAATADEDPRAGFARWWDSLHARAGTRWGDDPRVWVVTFRRVS